MPTVLAQVRDDPFRARQLGKYCRSDRIWFQAFSCLTDRCNVVDIYGQPWHAATS
jgi:hypothetical protein